MFRGSGKLCLQPTAPLTSENLNSLLISKKIIQTTEWRGCLQCPIRLRRAMFYDVKFRSCDVA